MSKFKLGMQISADIVDDRLKQTVDDGQRMLQEQAAAYVDVVLRDQLTAKLTKAFGKWYPSAQLAQIAIDILVEELKHTSIFLPGVQAQLTEVKDAAAPLPALPPGEYKAQIVDVIPAPVERKFPTRRRHMTDAEIQSLEDDISDGVDL